MPKRVCGYWAARPRRARCGAARGQQPRATIHCPALASVSDSPTSCRCRRPPSGAKVFPCDLYALMLLRQFLVRFLDDLWIDKLFGLRALDHRSDSNFGIVHEVLSNQLRLLRVTLREAVEQSLPRLLDKLERRLLETRTQSDTLEQRTETTSTEPAHGYSCYSASTITGREKLLSPGTALVGGFHLRCGAARGRRPRADDFAALLLGQIHQQVVGAAGR